MKLLVFQKGFNFSQDGPGNRLVYHLQGCNLQCPWCSNPEGIACSGGNSSTVEELTEEARRSSLMFFDGGGVTLTGGEATIQFDAIKEFLTALKASGISTCIETNGLNPRLPELFGVLDFLIMDLKHYDAEKHRAITGLPNDVTCANIRSAIAKKMNLSLRIPLIGTFNASEEDAFGFAALLTELGAPGHATLELLPYHEYGKDKYARLGKTYTMDERARITPSQMSVFSHVLEQTGIKIIKT